LLSSAVVCALSSGYVRTIQHILNGITKTVQQLKEKFEKARQTVNRLYCRVVAGDWGSS